MKKSGCRGRIRTDVIRLMRPGWNRSSPLCNAESDIRARSESGATASEPGGFSKGGENEMPI